MLRDTYLPVCTLAHEHSYFQRPETASVRFAPTPDTAAQLARAGLLLKATPTGLTVLRALPVPGPGEEPGPLRPLPDFLFPLRFTVQPLSAYFGNFTALPEPAASGSLPAGPTIYYFQAGPAAPDGELLLTMQQARPLALTPLALRVATPADAGPAAADEIRDLVRGKVLPTGMRHRTATGLGIDLRAWGAGHYQLQRHGQDLLDCYADDQLHALRAWAVLEIDQAALAGGALNIRLVLEARRTRWRYLVRYRPASDPAPATPENPSIKAKPRKGSPSAPVRFAMPKQRPATPAADVVFESETALALAEQPGYACTLHYTLHGTPMEVALPAAKGEVLCRPAAPATDPPGPAFSEIVVLL